MFELSLSKFKFDPITKIFRRLQKSNQELQQKLYLSSFCSISPEKDDVTIYEAIHVVEISSITPKITIQADKNKYFKVPTFDKAWINYKRSTRALAIKCRSERLMSKEVGTLYYENNLILITTEGAKHVPIDDRIFEFSCELEPKNFR